MHRLDRPAGPILGAVLGAVFATARTLLAPGDTLLVFTDGLIERRPPAGARGDDLGHLMDEIRVFIADLDPEEMPEALTSRLAPATPLDDTCMVAATSTT